MSVLWKTWDQTLNFTSFWESKLFKNIPFDEVIKCCHCTKRWKIFNIGRKLKMKKTLYGHTDSILSIDSSCEHRINCNRKFYYLKMKLLLLQFFSSGISGIYHNVIFTGMKSGSIEIWDSLDLTHISSITTFDSKYPITAFINEF
ncbi:beach domain-containing protein lvsb [Anaeramoeba ignava]|uniref:Beach domain-containing protein lvsb n=1 Tax=Anaeramoeba ignava TaxID=1746090 RepID=A0A9Q0LQG4_ANAIG|nr:beach domain-containing protein lvsb [Anaeramoeba ignava]